MSKWQKLPLGPLVRKGQFFDTLNYAEKRRAAAFRRDSLQADRAIAKMNVSDAEKAVVKGAMMKLADARFKRLLQRQTRAPVAVHDYHRNSAGRVVQSNYMSKWKPVTRSPAHDALELARVAGVKWKANVTAKRRHRQNTVNRRARRYDDVRALQLKRWIESDKQRAVQRARARRHKLAGRFV